MKTTLLSLILMLCTFIVQAQSRVTYTSIANGNWNDPAIWQVSDPSGTAARYPAPNANNVVTVNNAINLNIDYNVSGNDGFLTVSGSGSLTDAGQRTLTVGQQPRNTEPRLNVQSRPTRTLALDLYKINFIKAEAIINADIRTASCVTLSVNNDIRLTFTFTIGGNLVIEQGNSTINDRNSVAGVLAVAGRIVGYNINQIDQFLNVLAYSTGPLVVDCNAAPLPVELVSFNAKYDNKQVSVRWATASEKDAANFSVERSSDGRNFSSVALVPAAGTSATRREYEATDRSMRSGLNYYRLKQTDLDGTFTYSQVIPVQVGEAVQQLEAYGSQGNLNIVMQTPGTLQQLRVLDPMGRVLYSEILSEGATGLVTRSVPMAAGTGSRVYMVQAVTSQGVVNKKFMTVN